MRTRVPLLPPRPLLVAALSPPSFCRPRQPLPLRRRRWCRISARTTCTTTSSTGTSTRPTTSRSIYYPEIEKPSRTARELRRERVPADQRGPEARPVVQDSTWSCSRRTASSSSRTSIPGSRRRRRRGVRRAVPAAHGAADRRAVRPAVRPHRSRAHAPVRVRHHPDSRWFAASVPLWVERRAVGIRARTVDADRSDDGPRRRRVADDRAQDERDRGLRQRQQPAARCRYNPGHAVFEFIEAKFGKEGIRQFMFALRRASSAAVRTRAKKRCG